MYKLPENVRDGYVASFTLCEFFFLNVRIIEDS